MLLGIEECIRAFAVTVEFGVGFLLCGLALDFRLHEIRRTSSLQFRLSALDLDISLEFGVLGLGFAVGFDFGKVDAHVEVDLRCGELGVRLGFFGLALGFEDRGGGVDFGDFLTGFAALFGFLLVVVLEEPVTA